MEREIWEALGLRAPHRGTKARILVVAILDRDRQTALGEVVGPFHLCNRKEGTIRETTKREDQLNSKRKGRLSTFARREYESRVTVSVAFI